MRLYKDSMEFGGCSEKEHILGMMSQENLIKSSILRLDTILRLNSILRETSDSTVKLNIKTYSNFQM